MSSRSGSTTPEINQPLSTPPSPFLNLEVYLECHRKVLEQVIHCLGVLCNFYI